MTSKEHLGLLKDIGINTIRLDVFYYILEHMNPETKIYHGSYESISRGLNVSLSAVVTAVKKMQMVEYIRPIKNGQWQITDAVKVYTQDEQPAECEDMVSVEFKNYGS